MIKMLKELDNSDEQPLISIGNYNFLSQICENRNIWAHQTFTKFIYIDDFLNSREYQKQCDKLVKDHDRVSRASKLLENIRFKYCISVR